MKLRASLHRQLSGKASHVAMLDALEGLTFDRAGTRVAGVPHTIFQVLHHMIYWQDIALARLRGEDPAFPASAADGWATPPAPTDEADWAGAIAAFGAGLEGIGRHALEDEDLDRVVKQRTGETALDEILMIQGHNSYHLGTIVQLRHQLGAWPPPKGGETW